MKKSIVCLLLALSLCLGLAACGQKQSQEQEKTPYTPRPKSQIVLAWVLLAIVIFAIGGMCYWQMFGKF